MLNRLAVIGLLALAGAYAQGAGGSFSGVAPPPPPPPPPAGQIAVDPATGGQRPRLPQQSQEPQEPASVEGSVVNAATGEPLKRATVMLVSMQASPPYATTSDANGRFRLSSIVPGQYRLMVERTGFVRYEHGARGPARSGSAFSLAPGQSLKDVTTRMQPHAVIAGRVLDEDGEPLANVQLQASMHGYMQGRRQIIPRGGAMTNDLGEYRIFGLAPGKYYVNATHRSQSMSTNMISRSGNSNNAVEDEGYATTYYPGALDATSAVPVTVQPGQSITHIDFKLRRMRTVRVRGKVIGPVQQGRTMVMLLPQEDIGNMGARNLAAAQDADGTFEVRGVSPGAYYVIAHRADQNTQLMARVPVNVGNANVENIELVLRPPLTVTGTVTVQGESPVDVSQVLVTLQPKQMGPFGGGPGSVQVNADGTFSVPNIMPGTYRVTAGARGTQPAYVKSVLISGQELADSELTIHDGAAPVVSVVLSTAVARVTGQVIAEKPEASQGAAVVLIPAPEKRSRMDLYRVAGSDQNGKFSVPALPPGEYTLYAWDNLEPGIWMDPDFVAKYENKGKKITLKEGESVTVDAALLRVDEAQ